MIITQLSEICVLCITIEAGGGLVSAMDGGCLAVSAVDGGPQLAELWSLVSTVVCDTAHQV